MVQGWGGARLLATYESERQPIALRNTHAARQLTVNIGETAVDPQIEEDSAQGAAARLKAGAMLAGFGEQFASLGVQLGARYDGSPIVAGDGAPPADSFESYTPSGVPGGRAPHIWLDGGRGQGDSLYDRLGTGFTLLRIGASAPDGAAIVAAAARRRVPLTVLDIESAAGARTLSARFGADPPRPIHRLARQPPARAPGTRCSRKWSASDLHETSQNNAPCPSSSFTFSGFARCGRAGFASGCGADPGSAPPESRSSTFGLSFATRLTAVEIS